MAKRTVKVGSSGRLGPRYGVRVRKRVRDIEIVQKKAHECPACHHVSVKRVGSGIWQCRHCDTKFAAGAYSPNLRRSVSKISDRM